MRSPLHLGRLLACLLLWSAVFVGSSFAAGVDNGGERVGRSAAKAATLLAAAEFDAEDAIGATSDFDAADAFPAWDRPVFAWALAARQTRAFAEPLGDGRPATLVGIVVLHI